MLGGSSEQVMNMALQINQTMQSRQSPAHRAGKLQRLIGKKGRSMNLPFKFHKRYDSGLAFG